jgi:hypothetical protein
MADDGPEQPAVEPEQRHQVHGGERRRRDHVEVGAVAVVEAHGIEDVGEQAGVDALGPAPAVLVGLDLHERRLRCARQPRDRPRMGIGLLELVGRAVHEELEDVLEPGLALEEAGDRRRVVGLGDRAQAEVHLLRDDLLVVGGDELVDGRLERRLERAAGGEQRRRPLPALVHAGQAAVVELVAEVEGELQILVGERVAGGHGR